MHRVEQDGLVYYQFDMWPDLRHGIFTRKGGYSQAPWESLNMGGSVGDDPDVVRRNHLRMYEALSLREERACTVWQVHGAEVIIAHGPALGRHWLAQADGLVTDRPDTPLTMRFADCVPLLFRDPVRGVIGIAHAGWRGTVQGVGANVVLTMVEDFGCRPADIQVGIGPSIGPRRYQVGEEVLEAVQARFGTLDGLARRDPVDGTGYFDLWEANRRDLLRAGVGQVDLAAICTAENTDEFFSHRAEQGRTGRFGAVLSL